MSELKPCPFCGANKPFRTVTPESGIPSGDSGYRMTIKCRDRECGCIITRWALKKAWAIESAETAWNRRTQPANEPLTLEQLREEKDGAPLWMAYEDGAYGEWGLVCYNRDSFTVVGLHEHHKPDDYGKTWLAYRRPLERSNDNA